MRCGGAYAVNRGRSVRKPVSNSRIDGAAASTSSATDAIMVSKTSEIWNLDSGTIDVAHS